VFDATTANIIQIVQDGNDAGYASASYMLADNGTVYSAGYNSHGALGDGTTTNRTTYAVMNNLPTTAGQRIKYMVASGTNGYPYWHGLTEDGKVFTCGYNGNGALGVGDSTNRSTPLEVPMPLVCTDICAVGYSSEQGTAFLYEDGSMAQTGYGGDSQMPDDDAETAFTPQTVIF
jgi:alpha-tubulin suppressor-like RCC1 family protein